MCPSVERRAHRVVPSQVNSGRCPVPQKITQRARSPLALSILLTGVLTASLDDPALPEDIVPDVPAGNLVEIPHRQSGSHLGEALPS